MVRVIPCGLATGWLIVFYRAEEYHQDYLQKNPGGYTCHAIWFDSYLK